MGGSGLRAVCQDINIINKTKRKLNLRNQDIQCIKYMCAYICTIHTHLYTDIFISTRVKNCMPVHNSNYKYVFIISHMSGSAVYLQIK